MYYERQEQRLKRLIVSSVLAIISGCSQIPDIIQLGDCEHGIVTEKNLNDAKKIWPESQRTDVLISGGCYQSRFIKKEK